MNTPHVDVKGIVKVKVKGIVKVDIKRNPLMWSRRQDIKNFLLIDWKESNNCQLSGLDPIDSKSSLNLATKVRDLGIQCI